MIILYFLIIAVVLSVLVLVFPSRKLNAIIGVVVVVTHFVLTAFAYKNINAIDSLYFKFDHISVLLNGLLSVLLIPTFYHSKLYLERHFDNVRKESFYVAAIIMLIAVMSAVYFSEYLVILWVCIEITSLLVVFLVFHDRYQTPLEASWKYLFVSSVGIAVAFMGILLLAAQTADREGAELSVIYLMSVASEMNPLFLKTAFLFMLTGYSVKLNVFPLFAATIDAKTVAPSPVNAIISTALVNAGFIAIYRIYSILTMSDSVAWAQNVFLITGLISLVIAAIQLFRVKRFKRMFAFSSMEHMALVLLAFSVGKVGYYAAILHLVFHTLVKSGLFYQFGQIRAVYNSGWIKDTGSYFKTNPIGAMAFVLGLLSITAIPPSGMFVSEFLIFKALFSKGYFITAISALLLLTIIIYLFFKNSSQLLYAELPDNFNPQKAIINKYETISQFVLFALVIYLGLNPPEFFTDLIQSAITAIN
ncbi:MAG: proton-conducting transporter membrane subunit [Bacteroidota bacterium]|nr:proton-conducting transporter membrane subunit [Bacteroidota bacterium]